MNCKDILFLLIGSSVFERTLGEEQKSEINADNLAQAYFLAVDHSVSNLVIPALKSNGLTKLNPTITETAKKAVYFASITSTMQQEETVKVSKVFEEHKIPFLPLKGAVLRSYYPEPWMRTSCDVDILVKKEDFETARKLLMEELSYSSKQVLSHDVTLVAKNSTHIELHYDLIEEDHAGKSCEVLENVWDYAIPKNENGFEYVLTDEMFYFYHIAHMAKHFELGGCGIRSLLDLYILNKRDLEREKCEQLLKEGNLLKFAAAASALAEYWFGVEKTELTDTLLLMENFIISGSTYGTIETNTATSTVKNGKGKNFISLFFLPYKKMAVNFPILKKHKWLLPVFWIYRPLRACFQGRGSASAERIKAAKDISDEQINKTAKLLNDLELN